MASVPLAVRFWAKVRKTDSCWIWQACLDHAGYGWIHASGVTLKAHRVSWEMHNGPIPDGLEVCHNCPGGDNPACVNPNHLWLGTHHENMRDMAAKGRSKGPESCVRGDRHWTRRRPDLVPKGEGVGGGVLRTQQVVEIRAIYAQGSTSMYRLAKNYGVTRRTIQQIVQGKNWKHLL